MLTEAIEVYRTRGRAAWVERDRGAATAFVSEAETVLAAVDGVGEATRGDVVRVLDVFLTNGIAHGVGDGVWAMVGVSRNLRELVAQVSVENQCACPISTSGGTYHNRGAGTLLARYGAGLALVDRLAPSWGAAHYTAAEQRECDVSFFGSSWADHVESLFPRLNVTDVHATWRWPVSSLGFGCRMAEPGAIPPNTGEWPAR
ncbi:hypothetical protein [Embleya sp. AB8]|uniref:hypothetical protein n=1 Tax=Embleya sp. AB8 TaxID=3156304 RepID=UPI003C7350A6